MRLLFLMFVTAVFWVIPFKTEIANNQEYLGKRRCVTDCNFCYLIGDNALIRS